MLFERMYKTRDSTAGLSSLSVLPVTETLNRTTSKQPITGNPKEETERKEGRETGEGTKGGRQGDKDKESREREKQRDKERKLDKD